MQAFFGKRLLSFKLIEFIYKLPFCLIGGVRVSMMKYSPTRPLFELLSFSSMVTAT